MEDPDMSSHRHLTVLTVLTALTALAACTDATGPGDDHADPAGLRIVAGGTTIVSVNAARQVTGSITATLGGQTDLMQVEFLDDAGAVTTPNPEAFYLRVQLGNTTLASVQQNPAGAFSFRLQGLAAGTTTVQLSLMHGRHPGGHADYTSPNITLVVAP
jgi:hypothetical protein